nr:hypothetical protein [Tanacetum cinerariifolium]
KPLEDLKELAEYKESLENSSKEIVVSNSNPEKEEPPQNFDIHQLIEECSTKVSEEQKQKMENTILELVKICREKEFFCIHDNVDDLIESALNSKLLSINSNCLHLDKKEQEVENVVEQPAERKTRVEESLQNFRVIHKCSISLNNTSQISPIHTIASILSTEEPEHSLSMGYEHFSITPETESDVVTEFNAENLLPIPKIPKSDFDFEEEIRLIQNLLYDNAFPLPPEELNAEIADTIIESIPLLPIPVQDGNSQQEEIDIVTSSDDVLPSSDENDDDYDFLLEEVDLFLFDNSIPPGIENVVDDPEGDVRFLEELLNNDSILSHESSDANFEDSPLIPRPPPEPPDDNFDLEPEEISKVMEDIDKPDEHFNPGGEIFVSTNIEDVDYFPFMFVIRIFLPYLILPEISPLFLSAESEDTIFDPEGDIHFLEELLIDDSILSHESSDSNFEDNPSVPLPPPEPPDAEFDFKPDAEKEISVVMNEKDEFDDDYFPFREGRYNL